MSEFNILNLVGPPRSVPLLVRFRLLLGGFSSQFGWLLLGIGTIFVWLFTAEINLKDWKALQGKLENTKGVVNKIKKNAISGEHEITTYRHYYTFKGPNGKEYTGVSDGDFSLKVGDEVTVRYAKGRPEASRIRGMQTRVIGPMGLIPVIFPAVGLVLIIVGFRSGIRANRLLAYGELAKGQLKSKVKTKTEINDEPVYKLTFQFGTPDGTSYEAVAKTHLTARLEDQQEEPLLYDPVSPKNAVMLDNLPGSPRIDESGNIRAGSTIAALGNLVIPVISVVGHVSYIWIRYID